MLPLKSGKNRIIVVGAAEGFYAIGLMLQNSSQVIAFELEEKGRSLIAELARLNKLEDRITISGTCEPSELIDEARSAPRALIVMDVEGYETSLLNPDVVPYLRSATILVEIHETDLREVTLSLLSHFDNSHSFREIETVPRTIENFTGPRWIKLLAIKQAWIYSAMDESRGRRMTWLLFEPNQVTY